MVCLTVSTGYCIALFFAYQTKKYIIRTHLSHEQHYKDQAQSVSNTIFRIILIIVILMSCGYIGISTSIILGSIISIASISLQDIIGDSIAGLILQYGMCLQIGKTLQLSKPSKIYGKLLSIHSQYSVLLLTNQRKILIPNRTLLSNVIYHRDHNKKRMSFGFILPYTADITRFQETLFTSLSQEFGEKSIEGGYIDVNYTAKGMSIVVYLYRDYSQKIPYKKYIHSVYAMIHAVRTQLGFFSYHKYKILR